MQFSAIIATVFMAVVAIAAPIASDGMSSPYRPVRIHN